MPRRIAQVGDLTTTGSIVLPNGNLWNIAGKSIAAVNDIVSVCPLCGKTGLIIDGAKCFFYYGKPVAVDGSLVTCACPPGTNRIIASQSLAWALENNEVTDVINPSAPPTEIVYPVAQFNLESMPVIPLDTKNFAGKIKFKGVINAKSTSGFYASSFSESNFKLGAKSEISHIFYELYLGTDDHQEHVINIANGGWNITGHLSFTLSFTYNKNHKQAIGNKIFANHLLLLPLTCQVIV